MRLGMHFKPGNFRAKRAKSLNHHNHSRLPMAHKPKLLDQVHFHPNKPNPFVHGCISTSTTPLPRCESP